MPFRKELLQLSPQYLSFLVLLAFLISMLWKAYCIVIVWRCYKFLTLRKQALRNTVHYILPGEGGDRLPEPDYSSLLPDYEAACASAMKQPPPPSYAAAMASQLPAYPGDPHVNVITTVQNETSVASNDTDIDNNNVEDNPENAATGGAANNPDVQPATPLQTMPTDGRKEVEDKEENKEDGAQEDAAAVATVVGNKN
ncbi:uncharacterized protein LOC112903937 [Agrilus planipennis]|nr:uncharacterized protein LOC112903937 [Agrilus planipennis]